MTLVGAGPVECWPFVESDIHHSEMPIRWPPKSYVLLVTALTAWGGMDRSEERND